MPRVPGKLVLRRALPCVALSCLVGGCAAHRTVTVGEGSSASSRPGMASRSAAAGVDTFEVAYRGVGGAVRAPFRDFNMLRARIPVVLSRAATAPYSLDGVATCDALGEEVAALDLALGPDLDTPDLDKADDMYAKGAGLAADAALDAMRSAAVAYIPMRSVVRRVSGADRLERRTKRAILAGSVRRGFLKAVGMQRGCPWPAAPLGSVPAPATPPDLVIAAAPREPSPSSPLAALPPQTFALLRTGAPSPAPVGAAAIARPLGPPTAFTASTTGLLGR